MRPNEACGFPFEFKPRFLAGLFYASKKMLLNLIEQLKLHEGFRSNYYTCTAGKKTIGYGRNVDDNPFTKEELNRLGRCEFGNLPMTEDEAEYLLVNDVNNVMTELKRHIDLSCHSSARQAAIINMAFNLGVPRLLKFKKALAAMNRKQYRLAAIEMLDSRWADQVGQRAVDLAGQMQTGEWQ